VVDVSVTRRSAPTVASRGTGRHQSPRRPTTPGLDRIHHVVPLNTAERGLVSSWAAPEAWLPSAAHPGQGKYLIKTGERPGLPVALSLVGDEWALYETDQKIRPDSGWFERNSGGEAR